MPRDRSRLDMASGVRGRRSRPGALVVALLAVICACGQAVTPARNVASLPHVTYLIAAGQVGDPKSKHFDRLQLIALTGGQQQQFLPYTGVKDPDVNLQGTLVVFERYPGEIWVAGVDGSNAHRISPDGGGGWAEPSFMPDGHRVVAGHDLGHDHREIFTIDTSNGAVTQLTDTGQLDPWKWRPSVDITGRHLIVTYGEDSNKTIGRHSHIGVAALGHGMIHDFTPVTEVDPHRPSYDGQFSPDGRSIVYDAGAQIWLAAADGSGAHVVADGRLARFSRLMPGQILYIHDAEVEEDVHTQLWAVNTDGSGAHVIADGNFAESFCELLSLS